MRPRLSSSALIQLGIGKCDLKRQDMTIAPMKALLRARGPLKAPLGTASCRSTGRSFILNNVSFRTIHLRSLTAGRIRAPDRTLLTTSSTTSSTKRTGRGYATEGASGPSGTRSSSTPGRSSIGKWSFRLFLLLAFPATYLIGSAFPPQLVLLLYPRYSPPPPDAKSTRGKSIMDGIERELQGLGFVDEMRLKVKNGEGWYETRPYAKFDPQKVHNSLTAGTLHGPGRLAVLPILWAKQDESEAVAITHFGRALCGHDGIIHGGLIATTFDETLARNALLNLASHIGVTASITINFKSPLMADQFVVLRTKLDKIDGRKVWVKGSMETLDGQIVAESNALFIEPKWAQFLQSSGVTEALGRPTPLPEASPAHMDDKTERVI